MHFKNGREARNGDPVVAKDYSGKITAGVIHNLQPTGGACNVDVVVPVPGHCQNLTCRNVSEMYHAEDAFGALEEKQPAERVA